MNSKLYLCIEDNSFGANYIDDSGSVRPACGFFERSFMRSSRSNPSSQQVYTIAQIMGNNNYRSCMDKKIQKCLKIKRRL